MIAACTPKTILWSLVAANEVRGCYSVWSIGSNALYDASGGKFGAILPDISGPVFIAAALAVVFPLIKRRLAANLEK